MERLLELLSLNFQMAKSPKEARLQMYKCQAKKEFQLLHIYMDFIYEGCLLVIGNKLFDDKVFEFINNFPKLNSK